MDYDVPEPWENIGFAVAMMFLCLVALPLTMIVLANA